MSEAPAPPLKLPKKRENLLASVACNLLLPILALKNLSVDDRLGPAAALGVALAFPVGYFVYDLARRRNASIIAIFGFLNVLLTGGLGLMEADAKWIAVKEASVPLLIGLMVLLTARSRKSLLKTFLFNDQVFDVDGIEARVDTPEKRATLAKLFNEANWLLALSFLVSAALNYGLASWIVKSPGGTEAFNDEIGTLTWVSWIVISVPTMAISIFALFRLVKGLERVTGLDFQGLLHADHRGR